MLSSGDRKKIKEMDLYTYLMEMHLADIEVHNSWVRLKCNPSVNVHAGRSTWHDFSATTTEKYGDAIALLTKFWGYSFNEALIELLGYLSTGNITVTHEINNISKSREERCFIMPPKSRMYPKNVYSYLGKSRHIPYKLIDMLMDKGFIYMTDHVSAGKVIHNVVFTNPKRNFYEIRGCNSFGNGFHQSMAKTLNDCLILPGTKNKPKKIYVTEASIDAISLLALHGLSGKIEDAWYIALGGIAKLEPMKYLAKKYPDAEIIIAVDNDKAGDKLREAYKGVYKSIIPKNKDWNDDLCEIYNNEK